MFVYIYIYIYVYTYIYIYTHILRGGGATAFILCFRSMFSPTSRQRSYYEKSDRFYISELQVRARLRGSPLAAGNFGMLAVK